MESIPVLELRIAELYARRDSRYLLLQQGDIKYHGTQAQSAWEAEEQQIRRAIAEDDQSIAALQQRLTAQRNDPSENRSDDMGSSDPGFEPERGEATALRSRQSEEAMALAASALSLAMPPNPRISEAVDRVVEVKSYRVRSMACANLARNLITVGFLSEAKDLLSYVDDDSPETQKNVAQIARALAAQGNYGDLVDVLVGLGGPAQTNACAEAALSLEGRKENRRAFEVFSLIKDRSSAPSEAVLWVAENFLCQETWRSEALKFLSTWPPATVVALVSGWLGQSKYRTVFTLLESLPPGAVRSEAYGAAADTIAYLTGSGDRSLRQRAIKLREND